MGGTQAKIMAYFLWLENNERSTLNIIFPLFCLFGWFLRILAAFSFFWQVSVKNVCSKRMIGVERFLPSKNVFLFFCPHLTLVFNFVGGWGEG